MPPASVYAGWHKLATDGPFEYNIPDEDFQKNYEAENRSAAIVGYFTILAILISCLGLFGLAAAQHSAQKKLVCGKC